MIGKHINLIKVKHQSKENQSTLNEDVVKMLSKILVKIIQLGHTHKLGKSLITLKLIII